MTLAVGESKQLVITRTPLGANDKLFYGVQDETHENEFVKIEKIGFDKFKVTGKSAGSTGVYTWTSDSIYTSTAVTVTA